MCLVVVRSTQRFVMHNILDYTMRKKAQDDEGYWNKWSLEHLSRKLEWNIMSLELKIERKKSIINQFINTIITCEFS